MLQTLASLIFMTAWVHLTVMAFSPTHQDQDVVLSFDLKVFKYLNIPGWCIAHECRPAIAAKEFIPLGLYSHITPQ